jgi:hypothetical protein
MHHGAPKKYHETVTCGMMVLVNERVVTRPGDGSWESFVAENADLLRWLDGAFFEQYPQSVLRSDVARATFLLPRSPELAESAASSGASGAGTGAPRRQSAE